MENKNEDKRPGFLPGLLIGILAGALLVGVGGQVALRAYTSANNQYVVIGPQGTAKTSANDVLNAETIAKIEELLAYEDIYYNDTYDEEDIRNALYKGTLSGLGDPYSTYYTAEEYKELQESTDGNYCGIGAVLSKDAETDEVIINKVYDNTPAQEAGLKNGDCIESADGYKSTDYDLTSFVKKIRGEEDSTVRLKIYPETEKKSFEVEVERRKIDLPSVESKMTEDGIGYLQISEFQTNTAQQFEEQLKELQKQGMKGLVIDVRSNPGGLVKAVVEILDRILPEGTVVYTEDKYGKRDTYTSDEACLKCPIAVLVNGNSASASEILAGAIRDYDYGTLIGTKTFGKGIVQTICPLEDGDAIKITTAKYYTPDGQYIHGVGIEPDIELEYEYSGPEDEDYDMQYDNQVQKAFAVVRDELEQ